MMIAELDAVTCIVADRLHALPASVDSAEERLGQIGCLLRIAITAAQEKRHHLIRQAINVPVLDARRHLVGRAAGLNNEIIANFEKTGRSNEPRA